MTIRLGLLGEVIRMAIDTVRTNYTSQNPDLATAGNGRAIATWESTSGGIPDVVVARFE